MKGTRTMLRAAGLITLFLCSSIHPFASAQAASATVTVTLKIVDPTGAPIPHARMRIVPYPLDLSHKLETNSEGVVKVALSPGSYEVFVQANGFKPSSQNFDVAVNTSQMVTIALRVGEGSLEFPTSVRSPAEQQIVELENALWKHVANLDLESYEELWAQNAIACRPGGPCISGQKDAVGWLRRYQAGKLELEDYSLGPIEVRADGNAAVTFYSVRILWLDDLGRGTPKWIHVAHTWSNIQGQWRLLGENIS